MRRTAAESRVELSGEEEPQTIAEPPRTKGDRGNIIVVAALVVVVFAWQGGSAYGQGVLALTVCYAFMAFGMYIPFVLSDSLSFAYGVYAALGGYSVGLISAHSKAGLLWGLVAGCLVAAAVAYMLCWATSRLSQFFLVAVTVLFTFAFQQWVILLPGAGSDGIGNIRELSLFGWEIDNKAVLVAALVLLVATGIFIDRVRRSPWGAAARALRDIPAAVEAAGVNIGRMVRISSVFGAILAAIGGAFFAVYAGAITPETFTMDVMFLLVFVPLIGGQGSLWGALLGAFVAVQLSVNIPSLALGGEFVLTLGVILVLLVAPGGLLSLPSMLLRIMRRRYA